MHVATHTLAAGYSPGKFVFQRMARLGFVDGGVFSGSFAIVPELRVRPRMSNFTIVGVHHVAGCAPGVTVVTWLVIRTNEPGKWIIQTGLGDVQQRHSNPLPCSRPAV